MPNFNDAHIQICQTFGLLGTHKIHFSSTGLFITSHNRTRALLRDNEMHIAEFQASVYCFGQIRY